METGEVLEDNQQNLPQITQMVFNAIVSSADRFPAQLRSMCHCLYQVLCIPPEHPEQPRLRGHRPVTASPLTTPSPTPCPSSATPMCWPCTGWCGTTRSVSETTCPRLGITRRWGGGRLTRWPPCSPMTSTKFEEIMSKHNMHEKDEFKSI